jgi:hypothetical protein
MKKTRKKEAFQSGFGASDSLLKSLGRVGFIGSGTFEVHGNFIERSLARNDRLDEGNEEFLWAKSELTRWTSNDFFAKEAIFPASDRHGLLRLKSK